MGLVSDYRVQSQIGEGAHGLVHRAIHISGKQVAIKRLLGWKLGNEITREINALKQLDHENIVQLLDHFSSQNTISLVFEYMLLDLSQLMNKTSIDLTTPIIKAYMLMLLKGLAHCHDNNILHRDL